MLLRALSSVPRYLTQRFSEKAIDQFIVTGTSTFAMIVGNPFVADLFGGHGQWLTLPRTLLCLGVIGGLSPIPVRLLKPLGHTLQNRGSLAKNLVGFVIMLGPEVLYSILGFQCLAPILGWDQEKAFWSAIGQGSTRSLSGALISGKWGRGSPVWTLMRQVSMALMVTNSAAATSVASSDKKGLWADYYGWEIAGFNGLVAGVVLLIPKGRFG